MNKLTHHLYYLVFLSVLLPTGLAAQTPDSLVVRSPNGRLRFAFSVGAEGIPTYEIQDQNRPVILPSALGLISNPNSGRPDWDRDLRIISVARTRRDTTWKPVWGERALISDRFNELIITLQHRTTDRGMLQVIARAYDEGIAFRYYFPENMRTQILDIGQERTHFTLPSGTKAYFTDHAQGSYEERAPNGWTRPAELPVTLKLADGSWACIAQAEQVNYPRIRLSTAKEGQLVSQSFGEVTETSPYALPWRVVLVGNRPGDLLEHNYLIQNLNPPNQLKEVSWIQPGKVMREVTLSTSGAQKLVDFAVEQNIEYIHFDAGWYGYEYEVGSDATTVSVDPRRNPKGDLDLPAAIQYARSKGRKVILYVNHRALERQLDAILPLYKSWGVSGIKFGFVHTGSHRWTVWLHEAIRKAAQHQMVVDVHDEYSPTGFSRTFPNLLTQEGVRGNEEWPDATHNTVLPFTRFIAGAADYTFCFNQPRLKNTKCHQLALPVIYFSPLQYLYWYGKPQDFPNREEIAFWKNLPTVWEDTRVVDGTPGQWVSVARRKGADWYLGTITSTEARTVTLPLTFLPVGKSYTAECHEDDGAGNVRKTVRTVTAKDKLTVRLLASGGQAVFLKPKD
ncbi:glycoside hydrolase family 97 N-terminal domain-containing protein [Larkinella insperata]|uniref:Glycoside hydrolase family 97 N-terminal domain-containing protein n=1 Tax=Larkinella insperata TaxID=332158 RepID=A0ABW3QF06_9BACT|nr:glycoside hydrolase family 97 protein [Larkinella insperata]